MSCMKYPMLRYKQNHYAVFGKNLILYFYNAVFIQLFNTGMNEADLNQGCNDLRKHLNDQHSHKNLTTAPQKTASNLVNAVFSRQTIAKAFFRSLSPIKYKKENSLE